MAKNNQKQPKKKQKTITFNERADGMTEVVITKAPSKTVFGKIIIAVLAFALIAAEIASLIAVLIEAA